MKRPSRQRQRNDWLQDLVLESLLQKRMLKWHAAFLSLGSSILFFSLLSYLFAPAEHELASLDMAAPAMVAPCAGGAGDLGGTVFLDLDNNGVNSGGDMGQEGIAVTVFDCGGVEQGTATSDANGQWTVTGLNNGEEYRVEFSFPGTLSYLQPSFSGSNNGTDVQFASPTNCNVDFGVIDPTLSCQSNPRLVTNCYLNGTFDGGVVVSWNYNDAGLISQSRPAPTYEANNSQIGTVWGLAYHNATNNILTSAFLKRHSRLPDMDSDGNGDLGAIYQISMDGNLGNDNNPLWLDLDGEMDTDGNTISVGAIGNDAARGVNVGAGDPSYDVDAFDKVGKVGLGDIDLNAAQDELWVINLNDRKLYAIAINPDFTPGAIRGFDIPLGDCNGSGLSSDTRPFAVRYYQGAVYVGVTCSGENTGQLNTMSASVYRLDDDGMSTTFTQVLTFPLTYSREAPDNNGACNNVNNWRPWISTWPSSCAGNRIVHPQPILSDIEFNINNGEMILGFIDRFGHQSGFLNYSINTSDNTNYDPVSGGEILKSTPDGDGTFTIETNINSGGEFYDDDFRDSGNPTGHFESAVGGLAMIPGANLLVSTAFDPINGSGNQGVFNSGGTIKMNNMTGNKENNLGYQIYGPNDQGTLGKAAGLGDLELLCNRYPIQIGNLVWLDENLDGVQDACEAKVDGLMVKLYTKPDMGNAQLVATTTTNSDGEYYFTGAGTSGETWESGFTEVEAGQSYFIVFMGDSYDAGSDEITVGSTAYQLTTPNSGAGTNADINDSDVSEMNVPGVGDMPVIMFTASATDHTFDAGLRTAPPCELSITNLNITCNSVDDFTVNFDVSWNYTSATSETIIVTLDGMPVTGSGFTPSGTMASQSFSLNMQGNGFGRVLAANFSANTACSASTSFNLVPDAACSPPCTDGLGGTVFNDNNNDGIEDNDESGRGNIRVEVYECDNPMPIATTFTNINGDWNVDLTNITIDAQNPVRVEFIIPDALDFLQPSLSGTGNGTDVQFVNMASCDVDFGVFDPSFCTTPAPQLIIPCYVNGDPLQSGNEAFNQPVLVKIDYSPSVNEYIVQSQEIGSVYGVAQHRRAKKIFVGAVLRRHMGFGPEGSGAIYVMDEDGNNLSLFLDLNQGGISTGNITRQLSTGGINPSRDPDAFDGVGKTSLGDIDLSADEQTLWVMNLEESTLLEIPLGSDPNNPTAPAIGSVIEHPWPDPGCTGGVFRAWGIKFYEGRVYMGGVCSAENSGSPADIVSYVYAHDPDGADGNWSQVVEITDMDHTRGFAIDIGPTSGNWQAWSATWNPLVAGGRNDFVVQPQPILSDIEITREGNMVLGFMDRFGFQSGFQNLPPSGGSNTDLFSGTTAGDIVYLCGNGDGTYTLEGDPGCPQFFNSMNQGTPFAQNYPQGFNGGEFFYDPAYFNGELRHEEATQGALAYVAAEGEVITTIEDPFSALSGGLVWFSVFDGNRTDSYEIFNGTSNPGIGKAAGLGDIEALCDIASIQVGNYAWIDADQDGVQDACEDPIPGLTVKLYTKPASGNAELVATTTTGADGEYYFTGAGTMGETWETGFTEIVEGESYFIVFMGDAYDETSGEVTVGMDNFLLTTADMGEGNNPDLNDSDVSEMDVPGVGNMPVVMFTADKTDHTFDAGFTEVVQCDISISDLNHSTRHL